MQRSFDSTEREYIDAHRHDTYSQRQKDDFDHVDQLKSRIRNGPASRQAVSTQIKEFVDYLTRVEAFYRQVENQPQGRTEWEQIILLSIRGRIRRLQDHLEQIESVSDESEDILRDALHPLWKDLNEIGEVYGVPTPPPLPDDEEYRQLEKKYFDEIEEYKQRQRALQRLVEDKDSERDEGEHLYDILVDIRENEESSHPKPLSGQPKYRASRVLAICGGCDQKVCAHLGLVTGSPRAWVTFELTERGQAVYDAFENLQSIRFEPTENWQSILIHLFGADPA